MKVCTKCGEGKPLDKFFARKGASDGRMSSCKACKTAAIYAWREKNPERWLAYIREETKRPHRAEKIKAYRLSERGRAMALARERKPSTKAMRAAYLAANPDKAASYNKNRSLRHRARRPIGTVSAEAWAEIKTKHNGRCCYCNRKVANLTMDHVVPISAGGLHREDNIVPACRPCNSRKKDQAPLHFAAKMGRLCW